MPGQALSGGCGPRISVSIGPADRLNTEGPIVRAGYSYQSGGDGFPDVQIRGLDYLYQRLAGNPADCISCGVEPEPASRYDGFTAVWFCVQKQYVAKYWHGSALEKDISVGADHPDIRRYGGDGQPQVVVGLRVVDQFARVAFELEQGVGLGPQVLGRSAPAGQRAAFRVVRLEGRNG